MLGNDIKGGFEKENNVENKLENALTTRSYFNYDQGDYLLDRFAFGLTKNFDKKSVTIGGFKRTFLVIMINIITIHPSQYSNPIF